MDGIRNANDEQIEQLERKGEIFVLRPKIKTIGRMEKNYDRLTSFYEHGYVQMKEEYERLLEYLNK